MDALVKTLRIMTVMVCLITVQREAKEPTSPARMRAQFSRHRAPHLASMCLAAHGD